MLKNRPQMLASCTEIKRLSGLQPAAHGRLIVQVLRTEFQFQVLLFSPFEDIVDQRHCPDECSQQPHAVDPDSDTELEHGERQIDRVPAEAIRARVDDHRSIRLKPNWLYPA